MKTVLVGVVLLALFGAVGLMIVQRGDTGRWQVPQLEAPKGIDVPSIFSRDPEVMRVVYLNREGATLTADNGNDSRMNESSIVASAKKSVVHIPAFASSPRRWSAIVRCIRKKFEPFAVSVVEQRPVRGRYVMAMFGGRPGLVGHPRRVGGLSPFNGQPIEDAIVIIFSRALRENTRSVCESAAMEIAHAYGLDHSHNCRDLMTYLPPCGVKTFRDQDLRCGEKRVRDCPGGKKTQNSYRQLMEKLGPR